MGLGFARHDRCTSQEKKKVPAKMFYIIINRTPVSDSALPSPTFYMRVFQYSPSCRPTIHMLFTTVALTK